MPRTTTTVINTSPIITGITTARVFVIDCCPERGPDEEARSSPAVGNHNFVDDEQTIIFLYRVSLKSCLNNKFQLLLR